MTASDLLNEEVISLGTAARLFPGARGAERVNPSTVFRWATRGVTSAAGVVKLESFRAGTRLFTTRESVARFVEALTVRAVPVVAPAVRTPAARRRAAAAAAEALRKAGA